MLQTTAVKRIINQKKKENKKAREHITFHA